METLEGHLLIASPQLADENFARSLVLLIEHNREGAFGMILNRPVRKSLQELWREVGSAPCHSQQPIYLGGPVPGPLMSLHTKRELAESEPVPGVFFAAKKQHLDELVLDEEPSYKIFIGHAGWGAGQLENELRQGAWRTMPATAELVFSTAEDLWETVFRQFGQSLLRSMIHLKELPPDPTVN
ncbi:MAG: YqgE/AlgH family protein [Planctomycetaceae bacterium]|nr:YqgE/AlgH family protein [Planctomycetaceae bacterium]